MQRLNARVMDPRVEGSLAEYVLLNIESGLKIATRVRIAGDSGARRRGLLSLHDLDEGSGLWIMPCEAIHTFGMKMAIDVLFLDRNLRVKKLLTGLPPRRIAVCLVASSVVELKPGAISRANTKTGDRLSVRPVGEDHSRDAV